MRSLLLRKFPYLLAALLVLAGAGVHAGQPAAPESLAAADVTAGVKETVLPNGLKVLTREVHSAPVVAFQVWYKVGSRNERTGITGVSHLLEHLMFKGTKRYGLGEISRSLYVNGAEFNAGTYYDWTNYWETLAADRLELAMQIESDRMTGSRIDKADLASEMTVVRSELEGGENDPDQRLRHLVVGTAFQAHPYQWPIIGWRTDVENVSRDAIYDYYRAHYGPNNATVVIVGDFQTDKALAMVRKYFGEIKRIPEPPKMYTQEPPQRGEKRVVLKAAGSLPSVLIGYKAPPVQSPDTYAMDMLDMILSSGRASRLYQNIVQKQLAASAEASNPSLRDPFLFFLSATARPGGTPEKVEQALLDEAERLKKEPPTAEELTRARNQVEAQFIFGNNSVTEQANQLGYWDVTLDWRYLSTYLQKIRAVTPADIQRVAQKYLTVEGRTVGHFIPTMDEAPTAPPAGEASARVEKAPRGARPIPLPKPTRSASVARNITRFTLENGIRVIVQENRASPTVALVGTVPAGRATEPQEKPGLAGITAAMLSRGTQKRSALEFATALESVGASLSASSGNQAVTLSGQSLSRDLDRVLGLLQEMLREPAFRQEELERLKGLALAGLEQEADDPNSRAGRAFNRAVYPEGHPLRQRTLDEARASLQGITREGVEQFYRRQYGPDGMILVLAGDVKADHVKAEMQRLFGGWAKNSQARPITVPDVPLPAKAYEEVIRLPEKSETAIMWGFGGGLKRSDPDYYATTVMNTILGGGNGLTSRLADVVRDEQGLAYGISSFYAAGLYGGPFAVQLGTNPGNARKAVASLQAVVRRMREQGVTQREVDEAIAFLTGSLPVGLETNAGVANLLWEAEFFNLGPDYLDRYADLYRAVTVAAANEAAKKHLHPDRAVTILSGTLPEK